MSTSSRSSAACTSFSLSASDEVSGFSTRTCFPASRACIASGKCEAAGVAIATA